MLSILNLFLDNLRRSRDLIAIFRAMNAQTTVAVDLTDVLRAALVNSVSSFDFFIHEVVRLGMIEAYRLERQRTDHFLRFQVSLWGVLQAVTASENTAWLEQEILSRHSYNSFQSPDNVANAVRLISRIELWNEVSNSIGIENIEIRDTLRLLVDRRNRIVHEADILPDYTGQTDNLDFRAPIDDAMVEEAINFIEQIGTSIHQLVYLPDPDQL